MFLKKELTEYNRYQAFALHMAISLVIFFILLVFITQYWYPGILFDAANGWKAIGMIVGIDLVLGPLLTLIIFNHNKNSLKLDLSIIALIQVAALAYGCWTIHKTRPIALAFINTSFTIFYANANISAGITKKIADLNTFHFYYLFDDPSKAPSKELNPEQLFPYSDHSGAVKDVSSANRKQDLIALDPLKLKNTFIRIDEKTGKILEFVKTLKVAEK